MGIQADLFWYEEYDETPLNVMFYLKRNIETLKEIMEEAFGEHWEMVHIVSNFIY